MKEHKYAHVLRWIADGEEVQVEFHGWTTCSEEGVLRHILNLVDPRHFRIKPKTVKIGDRIVNAPVLNPKDGDTLYWWDTGCDEPREHTFDGMSASPESGDYFATEDDCVAARQAITALMTGK